MVVGFLAESELHDHHQCCQLTQQQQQQHGDHCMHNLCMVLACAAKVVCRSSIHTIEVSLRNLAKAACCSMDVLQVKGPESKQASKLQSLQQMGVQIAGVHPVEMQHVIVA